MGRWLSKVRTARPSLGLFLGLGVAVFLSLPVFLPVSSLEGVRVTLTDFLFVREGGPRLGARDTRKDIVLLLVDEKTHAELGVTEENLWNLDIQLYTRLAEQGARVVADTRILFEDSPGVQEILEALVQVEGKVIVLRDVRAESNPWFAEKQPQYLIHVGYNHLRIDSAYDLTQNIRYYPLLSYDSNAGISETMALKIAKTVLGLPPDIPGTSRELVVKVWGADLKRLGLLPADTDTSIEGFENSRAYLLSSVRSIPWVYHPSKEAPSTVLPAAFWINYVGPPGSFTAFSYLDALNGQLPEGTFNNKIVIITVPAIETYPVPTSTSRRANLGEILATVVQNLLDEEFLTPQPRWQTLCLLFGMSLLGGAVAFHLRPLLAFIILPVILLVYATLATWCYRSGTYPDMLYPPAALLLSGGTVVGYRYKSEERTRRRIYNLFGRYVPRPVVEELTRLPESEALALRCTRRDMTILFADIRGFTSFSESLSPEKVLSHLNALLAVMVACAFRHEGTVDKFIGDAVMVLFNAPLFQKDHPLRAVRTAIGMQEAIQGMETPLAFGIGIHTGEAVVGNVGTPDRLEYTAIGSVVNLASRLCDSARGGEIVISEATYNRSKDFVEVIEKPAVRVKGIDRELVTYLVLKMKE